MKWSVLFIAILIILFPQPLLFSYTQSLDDGSVKLVESTNYGLASVNGYIDVNVSEAKQMIESIPNLVILDVRTLEEHNEGHVEDAVLIPVNELESSLDELDIEKETLVYCRSGGRSATASQILVDNGFANVYNMLGGIIAWRDAGYWIEIIHEGDLIINGTQVFVIENCTFIQTGNIYVKDYGNLVIRNSIFTVNQSCHGQYEISIGDYGKLIIEDAQLTSNNQPIGSIQGHAAVTIKDSLVNCDWSTGDQSDMRITNSTVTRFWMCDIHSNSITLSGSSIDSIVLMFMEPYNMTLEDLKPSHYTFWQFRRLFVLTLENTTVKEWDVGVGGDSKVTLADSELSRVILDFYENEHAEIDDLEPGLFAIWSLHGNQLVQNTNYDLTLRNSTVNNWEIWVSGDSEVDLVNVVAHVAPTGRGKVHAENSIINTIKCEGDAEAVVIDSRINGGLYFADYRGRLFFNNTMIEIGRCSILNSDFYIYGNFDVDYNNGGEFQPVWAAWFSSNVTRGFNLTVMDKRGSPIANASLTLFDQDNAILWNGKNDDSGPVSLNLTFTDGNYTDNLRLEAVKKDYSAVVNVSFLSDTPITLTMRYFADLNGDGTVNIMDIALVAKAYGTKEGDPNWNVIADLDDNGIIDIRDIAKVAKDYGKTV